MIAALAKWHTSTVHRGAPWIRLALPAVLATSGLIGCTSSPPLPSAGTQTTGPSASDAAGPSLSNVIVSAEPNGQPSVSPSSHPSVTGEPSPTPAITPVPTMPPEAAIAGELSVPGSLTACLALLGAPAASINDAKQPVGYNVAFANEIAARLSLTPVIQQPNFGELISMVQSHACDISVSSQNITADRSGQVNLVPYTQAKLGFPVVVAINNPKYINTLDDLCGQVVSAAAGSTAIDEINGTGDFTGRGLNAACEAKSRPNIALLTYPTERDAVQALLDDAVAAYLGNANFVAQYPRALEKSSAVLPAARQGIAVASDHPALTTGVEAALGAMISDGTYLKILRQYLPSRDVDNFSIID